MTLVSCTGRSLTSLVSRCSRRVLYSGAGNDDSPVMYRSLTSLDHCSRRVLRFGAGNDGSFTMPSDPVHPDLAADRQRR